MTSFPPARLVPAVLLALLAFLAVPSTAEPGKTLEVDLDSQGPVLVLASPGAAERYAGAIRRALALHPGASRDTLDLPELRAARARLGQLRPRYTLVFLLPRELDANLAWNWVRLTARLDDDPFVDTRTGFLTGEACEAYFQRLEAVLAGRESVPRRLVDNLGPGMGISASRPQKIWWSTFLPGVSGKIPVLTWAHAAGPSPRDVLESMEDCGLLHLGGHGDPQGVIDGLNASQAARLRLSPCLVFNGACYGGVTRTYWGIKPLEVAPERSFCLQLLSRRPLGYLASLHPDHGMPVYQEVDRLFWRGGSAGDLIKGTQDEVILSLGKPEALPRLRPGKPANWSTSQVMQFGTGSRVLFGDPSVRVKVPRLDPPFKVTATRTGGRLKGEAVLGDVQMPASLTDTFQGDLCSRPNMFNSRALFQVPLPGSGTPRVSALDILEVSAAGKPVRHRLAGWGVEDGRILWIQVDCEATDLFRGPMLHPGARVRFQATLR